MNLLVRLAVALGLTLTAGYAAHTSTAHSNASRAANFPGSTLPCPPCY